MTDLEIKAGLLTLEPSHPFVQALKALLAQSVLEEQDSVTNPNLTDGGRHFNAGRLAHAKDFAGGWQGIVDEARKEQADALAARQASQG